MNWWRRLGGVPVTRPVRTMLLIRLGELLVALLFLSVLPWWQPTLWFALVFGTHTLGFLWVHRPAFKALPHRRRQRIHRCYIWLSAAAVGSSCWLLYVPGDPALHAIQRFHLVASAGLVAMWGVRDIPRTALAVALILGPTALRIMVEGVTGRQPMVFFMGTVGIVLACIIVYTASLHAQRITRESVLRRQAEQATGAMAAMSLDKSRFFAAASHDLRQPVHAIGLYLESLTQTLGPEPDPLARHALDGIRQSWRALDDLLLQLLDMARVDAGATLPHLEPIALAPLIRDVVRQHGPVAERAGVRVVVVVRDEARRHVCADDIMLRRVLSNLLDNAIKFSPAGRCVAILVRLGARVCRVQVRDAGLGIAAEQHEAVFDEFVQLDNQARSRQRGYGLGLAISRRFIRLMAGSLELRSEPGKGTCLTITLPRADALRQPETAFSTPLHGDARPLPVRNILLVEDDPLVADAMLQLLTLWGQNVRHVETEAEAWRLRGFGQLAICDVRLPGGGNGFNLALRLRALGKPVFLLSGETGPALKARAEAAGLPLIAKPLSPARLLELLRTL